ncbi:hypothetical protein NL676_014052 [Syzygium grande]|nr:hypothetical protein NL676_014052 [Syzygium grande]
MPRPNLPPRSLCLSSSKKFEGSSDLVQLRYRMCPVLSNSPINLYLIWYSRWASQQKLLIKDFLLLSELFSRLEESLWRILRILPVKRPSCERALLLRQCASNCFTSRYHFLHPVHYVIKEQLEDLLASFKEIEGVEWHWDGTSNGHFRVKISGNATKTVAEIRRPVEELMRGKSVDHPSHSLL